MDIQKRIASRIKALREEKKLTQEGLAWQSNLDRTYMNHVENGRRNITVISLEKIVCNGLKMNLTDFFNHDIFNDADTNN
ncbi:MAG: helix-turn-helix transcriptional regulator [Mariniphaga sp.]